MSKYITFLPSRLNQVIGRLPKRAHVHSATLVNDGKRCGIELIWDDPDRPTGFTFPVEVEAEALMRELSSRAEAEEIQRQSQKQQDEANRVEAERLEKEAAAQLAKEEAATEPATADERPASEADIAAAQKLVDKPAKRRKA